MFWRYFPTKTAAEVAIRAIVDPHPMKIPFESTLISDLILERHYFCSMRRLRPSRFRKLPGYGHYQFEGDFSDQLTAMPISWHPVSWAKCLKRPLTEWERIVRAMRDRVQHAKEAYVESHPICQACSSHPSEEVHHAKPTFHEISESVRKRVSGIEISQCFADWNWFLKDNFTLPKGHVITSIFDTLHASAQLEALCRECHNKTKRSRRFDQHASS